MCAILMVIVGFSVYAEDTPCNTASPTEFCNPIQARTFSELIQAIARDIRFIAMICAPVAIIFAGFKFIISASQGDEAGLKKSKSMLVWVIAGTAVVVASSTLADAIVEFAKTL